MISAVLVWMICSTDALAPRRGPAGDHGGWRGPWAFGFSDALPLQERLNFQVSAAFLQGACSDTPETFDQLSWKSSTVYISRELQIQDHILMAPCVCLNISLLGAQLGKPTSTCRLGHPASPLHWATFSVSHLCESHTCSFGTGSQKLSQCSFSQAPSKLAAGHQGPWGYLLREKRADRHCDVAGIATACDARFQTGTGLCPAFALPIWFPANGLGKKQ